VIGPSHFTILVSASIAAACAPSGLRSPEMLPPEIAAQFPSSFLEGLGEPPLWRAESARGFSTRVRLTIGSGLLQRVSIRIDELASGRLAGHVTYIDPRARGSADGRTNRRFRVTRAQFDALQQQAQRARLWAIHPEFWAFTSNDICIDGMELIFERVDANGYRFSTANAQCTAPPAMLQLAEQMIELSGQPGIRRWLQ
jgi:hypothetical protein